MSVSYHTIISALDVLPRRAWLTQMKLDAREAQARGYYEPEEDDRLREVYAQYLSVRVTLLKELEALLPKLNWGRLLKGSPEEQRVFVMCLLIASTLTRYGLDLVELARTARVTWQKLDEAEDRFGIPRKSFTRIYQRVTHPRQQWRLRVAWKFFRLQRSRFGSVFDEPEIVGLIEEEQKIFFEKKRLILWRRILYRLFSLHRRPYSSFRAVSFHLFRVSGSLIAELKQPHVKEVGAGKRVTATVKREVASRLAPGDVIITRHDDAVSNLFLPGFWPHAALYLGSAEQRKKIGLELPPEHNGGGGDVLFLEAKKDGVKVRPLSETLEVDAFLVLRPQGEEEAIRECLLRGLSHAGKRYDFLFDFRQTDRLACTAVVYRSYHSFNGAYFKLRKQSGRLALSAEDLIEQLRSKFGFELQGVFGFPDSKWTEGELADKVFKTNSL